MIVVVMDGSGEKFQYYELPKESYKYLPDKTLAHFKGCERPLTINIMEG